jgi:hypothetical protein
MEDALRAEARERNIPYQLLPPGNFIFLCEVLLKRPLKNSERYAKKNDYVYPTLKRLLPRSPVWPECAELAMYGASPEIVCSKAANKMVYGETYTSGTRFLSCFCDVRNYIVGSQ